MKIKVKSSDLAYANKKPEEKEIKTSSTYKKTSNIINIKPEIKLLGLYGYEAVSLLDKYIDDAVIAASFKRKNCSRKR